mmetsp:Transcript_160985/g.516740  ORF Transcript_160985/g.516740 Transcript_160985/m.516740 type:complete len:213 (+) Transcript_160985:1529-2167(+)
MWTAAPAGSAARNGRCRSRAGGRAPTTRPPRRSPCTHKACSPCPQARDACPERRARRFPNRPRRRPQVRRHLPLRRLPRARAGRSGRPSVPSSAPRAAPPSSAPSSTPPSAQRPHLLRPWLCWCPMPRSCLPKQQPPLWRPLPPWNRLLLQRRLWRLARRRRLLPWSHRLGRRQLPLQMHRSQSPVLLRKCLQATPTLSGCRQRLRQRHRLR